MRLGDSQKKEAGSCFAKIFVGRFCSDLQILNTKQWENIRTFVKIEAVVFLNDTSVLHVPNKINIKKMKKI